MGGCGAAILCAGLSFLVRLLQGSAAREVQARIELDCSEKTKARKVMELHCDATATVLGGEGASCS